MADVLRFNPFGDDPRDRNNMVLWMQKTLNKISSQSLDGDELAEIEELHDKLEILDNFLISNSDKSESVYENEFLDLIFPLWEQLKALSKTDFSPGIWRTEGKRELMYGYSEFHKLTVIRKKSATSVNYYSDIPELVTWDCTPITQKNQTFYIVRTKVAELNAVCSVPSFDKSLPTSESGFRVLDRSREPKQWQRNPNPDRIAAIESFIGENRNIVANTPLVYAPESKYIKYQKNKDGLIKSISIDFSFLHKENNSFSDHKDLEDLRPLWLIDGQHRIRGISQNSISLDLDIAFVLFPYDLGVQSAAKIFAEVNTLARDLSDLHKIFMRHRFQLASVDSDKDFRPFDNCRPEEKNSRMNSLSYECAAHLTSISSSPLRELIRILDENVTGNHIIDAKMFVKNARGWFSDNGPYPMSENMDKNLIFEEVCNYFIALESVVNHYVFKGPDEWPDGDSRWLRSPPKNGKNTLQNTRCFRAILRLLPTAVSLCSGEDRPFSKNNFEKVLAPLAWVDWNNEDLHSAYAKKTGEQWWKCLLVWMENALINGKSYSYDEVMSNEIYSEAGKGILAPPAKPEIKIEENSPEWPEKGKDLIIISSRPVNCTLTSTWTLRDTNLMPRNHKGKKKFKAQLDSKSRFVIPYYSWMDHDSSSGKRMEIVVDWMNANGENSSKLIINNPKY